MELYEKTKSGVTQAKAREPSGKSIQHSPTEETLQMQVDTYNDFNSKKNQYFDT